MPTEPAEPNEPDEATEPGEATESDGATEETGSGEADPADSAEQRAELTPQEDDPLTGIDPDSANEADASEQTRVVPVDEEDYR